MGAENAKHHGTHTGPGGVEPGITTFWDCCGAETYDAPGCCRQRHLTYDDPEGGESALTREAAARLDREKLAAATRLRGGSTLLLSRDRMSTLLRLSSLFIAAGLFEIGGGWLVWQRVRLGAPWQYAAIGGAALVAYGLVATLQPVAAGDFGRIDAAYGGAFILMSFAWSRVVDGMRFDLSERSFSDLMGGLLCLMGVALILVWPRGAAVSRVDQLALLTFTAVLRACVT